MTSKLCNLEVFILQEMTFGWFNLEVKNDFQAQSKSKKPSQMQNLEVSLY